MAVFSKGTNRKVSVFCELIRQKAKEYFIKNQIENVFIALGILFYPSQEKTTELKKTSNLIVKELYIGAEIRRYRRVAYHAKLEVLLPNQKSFFAKTLDLSKGGICFISAVFLKTDLRIKIRFRLMKNKNLIETGARIAWIKKLDRAPGEDEQNYKIGIEFINLKLPDKEVLLKELKLFYE